MNAEAGMFNAQGPIPTAPYSDCLNLDLKQRKGWWDDKGMVYFAPRRWLSTPHQMYGSFGAGSYVASWTIDRDGRHSGIIDQQIPRYHTAEHAASWCDDIQHAQ
jgi:hypothetical protein